MTPPCRDGIAEILDPARPPPRGTSEPARGFESPKHTCRSSQRLSPHFERELNEEPGMAASQTITQCDNDNHTLRYGLQLSQKPCPTDVSDGHDPSKKSLLYC